MKNIILNFNGLTLDETIKDVISQCSEFPLLLEFFDEIEFYYSKGFITLRERYFGIMEQVYLFYGPVPFDVQEVSGRVPDTENSFEEFMQWLITKERANRTIKEWVAPDDLPF